MRSQLGEVSQGVAIFNMAGSTQRAMAALRGLIRPFNEVRELAESLEACCPLQGEPKPAQPETDDAADTEASAEN